MLSIVTNENGREIITDTPIFCIKCNKELHENEWVYFCELNKKCFCESPECKRISCPYQYVRDNHEDHYGPLKFMKIKR